jgi:GDP-4-dehydro-6-deoxy-D-mannose reductase
MRVLVTGITGFVGGHLADYLLAHGDHVSGCSRHAEWPKHLSHLSGHVSLWPCDLGDPQATVKLFERETYDAVFHLAGLANPRTCRLEPLRAERENVAATRNVYEAIRRSGQRPRVLFVSTSYVYGQPRPQDLPVGTACPVRPEDPYGASKWAAEQLSTQYVAEYGLDIIRVRPFNHTGPRQPTYYVVPEWAQQIAAIEAGRRPHVLRVGNLDTRRDYTDVRDVVRAYRLLIEKACADEVYNLGSGVGRSGREILEALRSLSRAPLEIESDPCRVREGEAPEIVADAAPLRQLTGWQPQIDLRATLHDTLNFWRACSISDLQGGES